MERNVKFFTSEEISELCQDCIEEKIIEQGRWLTFKLGIIEMEGHFYPIRWAEGNTEYQENEFEDQESTECFKVTKMIEVWE
jgi:hypothetical protein